MTGIARSLAPLAGAWKQALHLATNGSGPYGKGLNLVRNGAVAQIQAQPGRISAPVAAKKATHQTAIHVPELTATHGTRWPASSPTTPRPSPTSSPTGSTGDVISPFRAGHASPAPAGLQPHLPPPPPRTSSEAISQLASRRGHRHRRL